MEMKKVAFFAIVAAMTLPALASAVSIDFEGLGDPYVDQEGGFFDVGEYRFTLSANIESGFLAVNPQGDIIEPGTSKLFVANHSELTISRADGAPFSLLDLDIGGSWVHLPERWADGVDIMAGANSKQVLLPKAVPDYHHIAFNSDFQNVTSVTFSPFSQGNIYDYEFVIDNVNVIPEPATLLLLGLGGLVLTKKIIKRVE